MQSKFTLASFKESFVWKVNDSGTRQIKEPVLSGFEEPVPTPKSMRTITPTWTLWKNILSIEYERKISYR